MYNHRGEPTGTNHRPTQRSGMRPPAGYGDYSNPGTMDAQRQTDRAFDSDEARVNDRLSSARKMVNPKNMGNDLGGAMADALKPLGHAITANTVDERTKEEDGGLISSDHYVKALGASLEARGYKRL